MNWDEKDELRRELIDLLLKNTKNDSEYFNRLVYALQCISTNLRYFENEIGREK